MLFQKSDTRNTNVIYFVVDSLSYYVSGSHEGCMKMLQAGVGKWI